MRAVAIDFAPRGVVRTLARMPRLAWSLILGGVVLGLTGLVVMLVLAARSEALHDEAEQRLAAAARERLATQRAPDVVGPAQAHAVNAVVHQLNIPWGKLLGAIERATPSSIALLELVPDADKRTLKGIAEAATAEAMLGYVERLNRESGLGRASLVKHEVNAEDANRPLRFEFLLEWRELGS